MLYFLWSGINCSTNIHISHWKSAIANWSDTSTCTSSDGCSTTELCTHPLAYTTASSSFPFSKYTPAPCRTNSSNAPASPSSSTIIASTTATSNNRHHQFGNIAQFLVSIDNTYIQFDAILTIISSHTFLLAEPCSLYHNSVNTI